MLVLHGRPRDDPLSVPQGVRGYLSADDGLLGGWSEYIYLRPGVHVIALPAELDWRAFLAGGCGMPTALHAVTLGEVVFGDTVVVQGAGRSA